MIGIFLLALCVGAAMGHEAGTGSNGYLYACPPSTNDERAFREFVDIDQGPKLIPSFGKAWEVLRNDSAIQQYPVTPNDLRSSFVSEVPQDRLLSPFIRYCCPSSAATPTSPATSYDCTSVSIPIWWVNYGSHGFCWVVYPSGENRVYRNKCTCVRCVYKDQICPLIGRCVETYWRWRFMVIYCPLTNRYFAIFMIVPGGCRCRPYCPWWVTNQVQAPTP